MKKALTVLLLISALALCGLNIAQWRREAQFRSHITKLTSDLQAENKLRVETAEKAAAFELEIARLTQLRADTEAKLLTVTDQLSLTQIDQLQRGVSIAILSSEFAQARAKIVSIEKLLAEASAAISARNSDASGQNTAITEANTRLKQLTAERDKAIADLNERTKAYNELVARYNKLAK